MDFEKILADLQRGVALYGMDILAAAAIFIVGRWLAAWVAQVIEKILLKAKVDVTLAQFAENLTYAALLVFVVIAALSKLGIQTASFIAVLGAAGFAVGMALQGSLSNFAAGVLILIFRPYKVGDVVTIAGITGQVTAIEIFNTILCSGDNVRFIVPNSQATSGCITNTSAHDTRRIDLVIGVSYSDDLKKAKRVISDVLQKDSGVLKNPAALVAVAELGESSVNFYVRPWVKAADYWDVRFRLIETIKETLDAQGISIPFPQRDVHVFQKVPGAV